VPEVEHPPWQHLAVDEEHGASLMRQVLDLNRLEDTDDDLDGIAFSDDDDDDDDDASSLNRLSATSSSSNCPISSLRKKGLLLCSKPSPTVSFVRLSPRSATSLSAATVVKLDIVVMARMERSLMFILMGGEVDEINVALISRVKN
jgi:hypothetical protein